MLTSAVAIASAAVSLYVAVLNYRFVRAPGWSDQRWFSAVASAIAGYSVLNVPITLARADATVLLFSQIQLLVVALHSAAWLMYSRGEANAPLRPWERALLGGLLALGIMALVPGALCGLPLRRSTFGPIGMSYVVPRSTWLGDLLMATSVSCLALVAGRFLLAWRRRSRGALLQFAAILVLFLLGANDALVAMGVYSGPFLVDVGFVIPVGLMGYSLTSRFADDARALAELRHGLQRLVDERTRELTRAQEALHRAEKLAALGKFAAGVAHEVNNPAAVVSANLKYLEEELAGGAPPPDARECVRESLDSVSRISAIVRQLLDAGRLAADTLPLQPVPVARSARAAAATARARTPERVAFTIEIDEALHVQGQERPVVQVLSNLVLNGAQAIPEGRPGRVSIRADRAEGRVRITVEDDGVGMSEAVLRRIYEPFFSTKPFGAGTGLGLCVSRGLSLSMGGRLDIESAEGKGTRATLELPEAARPEAEEGRSAPDTPVAARRTLLLLDDQPAVLRAVGRMLEPHYEVVPAASVKEALALADLRRPDLLLCDVDMPDGGGEALYRWLCGNLPELAGRVVFFTGGAPGETARTLYAGQAQPILEKPLDLGALARVAERLAPKQRAA
jgi:signal transduction histidine kinase/ActR/RegA family two-component response regulator